MSNAQKTPIARALNEHTFERTSDLINLLGKGLPCSVVSVEGSIVTVKFEVNSKLTLPQVKMPIAGSEYVRLPIQAGCKGVALSADARLGAMTGLGEGVASLASQPANLSAMTFFPLGNKEFVAPKDKNKIELYGPDGAIIRNGNDTSKGEWNNDGFKFEFGNASFEATASGIIMKFGGNNITISAAGISFNGEIVGTVNGAAGVINFGSTRLDTLAGINAAYLDASGDVIVQGIGLVSHKHNAPPGGGITGGPLP